MLFTAISYQQMSQAFPVAGSVYAYVGRGLNSQLGFLAGWAILLDYLLVPTLLYVIGANAMANVFPGISQPVWIVFFVLVNTLVNLRGIQTTARANRLFLYGQLVVLVVFVVLASIAISNGVNGASWTMKPLYNPAEFSLPLIFSALSVAVLSFLGFDAISTLSEETRGGSRAVGRATLWALTLVAALFMVQTWLAAMYRAVVLAKEAGHLRADADERQIAASKRVGAPAIELHTGRYSELHAEGRFDEAEEELDGLRQGARIAHALGLEVHAGHGLTYDNVEPIAAMPEVMELNIGHFLMGEAIFRGLGPAIEEMRRRMDLARDGLA